MHEDENRDRCAKKLEILANERVSLGAFSPLNFKQLVQTFTALKCLIPEIFGVLQLRFEVSIRKGAT